MGKVKQRGVNDVSIKESIFPRFNLMIKEFSSWSMLLLIFLGMCVIFIILSPRFLTLSNILNVFRQASVLFMLASGQTLVLLVGGIDLSQGSMVGLVSVVTTLALIRFGLFIGTLAGLLVGASFGLIYGLLVTKGKVPPFIVTLGGLFSVEGITLLITDGQPIFGIPESIADPFSFIGEGYVGIIPVPVILLILALFFLYQMLRLTRFGRYIYAIGGNEEAARLSGIKTEKWKTLVYVLDGILVAIGGIILTSRVISGQPLLGGGLMMQSIGAAVIGGNSLFGGQGGILQTLLGVCFISFMTNGLDLTGISTFIKETLIGILIIIGVLVSVKRKAT